MNESNTKQLKNRMYSVFAHPPPPCLRSFGVVLWELLTGETPYKDVDSSAIIWGVGSNSLHLPVPTNCPEGFKLLMKMCWNAKARNRPSFKQIQMHVDIAASELLGVTAEQFFADQRQWKEEVQSRNRPFIFVLIH